MAGYPALFFLFLFPLKPLKLPPGPLQATSEALSAKFEALSALTEILPDSSKNLPSSYRTLATHSQAPLAPFHARPAPLQAMIGCRALLNHDEATSK